ncbi:hypothetical protein Patl1_34225 [Pistacia atlantica]|uniref:Uncharacterized protein n=1 Tax=Pistacia atlantica TaxID=434234 RepID=A0ACC0ZV44_9ROSI|nr:hypothetical protein Patl1_34225 [Pistacia atlantica]
MLTVGLLSGSVLTVASLGVVGARAQALDGVRSRLTGGSAASAQASRWSLLTPHGGLRLSDSEIIHGGLRLDLTEARQIEAWREDSVHGGTMA